MTGVDDLFDFAPGEDEAAQQSLFAQSARSEARDELIATWKAFAAPLVKSEAALLDDPELVRIAIKLLGVYADHPNRNGLTLAQLSAELVRAGVRCPPEQISKRLEALRGAKFLEPFRKKAKQERFVIRPAGLVGALAASRVAQRGGVDELALLLDRTRNVLDVSNPDPRKVLEHLASCRHALIVFAIDLRRRVLTGTIGELLEAGRQHDHRSFTKQVVDLNELITARFSGLHDLEEAATALIEAEQFYRLQVRAAITKVLDHGTAGLNFDVLSPGEYEDAATTAGLEQLACFGTSLLVDAPEVCVDVESLLDALQQYRPRPPVRGRPPRPLDLTEDPDPLAAVEHAWKTARRQRQREMDALLAGVDEVDLTAHIRRSWADAMRILAAAMLLDGDPVEPYVMEMSENLHVEPGAPVTYLHPMRLIRIDDDLDSENGAMG